MGTKNKPPSKPATPIVLKLHVTFELDPGVVDFVVTTAIKTLLENQAAQQTVTPRHGVRRPYER